MQGKTYQDRNTGQTVQVSDVQNGLVYFSNGANMPLNKFSSRFTESQGVNESYSSYDDDSPIDARSFWQSGQTALLNSFKSQLEIQERDPEASRRMEQAMRAKGTSPFVDTAHTAREGENTELDDRKRALERMGPRKNRADEIKRQQAKNRPDVKKRKTNPKPRPQLEDDVVFDDDPPVTKQQPKRVESGQEQRPLAKKPRPKGLLDELDKDHSYNIPLELKIKSFSPDVIKVLQKSIKNKTKTEVNEIIINHIVRDIVSDKDTLKKQVKKFINQELKKKK